MEVKIPTKFLSFQALKLCCCFTKTEYTLAYDIYLSTRHRISSHLLMMLAQTTMRYMASIAKKCRSARQVSKGGIIISCRSSSENGMRQLRKGATTARLKKCCRQNMAVAWIHAVNDSIQSQHCPQPNEQGNMYITQNVNGSYYSIFRMLLHKQ
jgi:hypothetical protein